ncbi:hypothetical protein F2P79_003153 [Pimephales promelas]|nr:hypothetical protein F2P79_003153 [Pimephales promelas]
MIGLKLAVVKLGRRPAWKCHRNVGVLQTTPKGDVFTARLPSDDFSCGDLGISLSNRKSGLHRGTRKETQR